jgi:hypothetical protein
MHKMCSFASNVRSTPGDTTVNRGSSLACHNSDYLTGPACSFAAPAATTNTGAQPTYSHRQHQNVSAECTTSFHFSIIAITKCSVQFHSMPFSLNCMSTDNCIITPHFISQLLRSLLPVTGCSYRRCSTSIAVYATFYNQFQ